SFTAAATLQMQRDRFYAVNQAASFEAARSREIASTLDAAFDRYADLGAGFARQTLPPDDLALSNAQAPALKNIVTVDAGGETRLVLHDGHPRFLPLPSGALDAARTKRILIAEPS